MQSKTKLITSIVAVSLVAVFSIVGLIVVLAAYTANLTNSYNISYTANGVACDVSASYRKATTGETTAGTYTTIKSGTSDKITFTGKDTTSTGEGGVSASFNSLSDQALTKNQYFVLRYIIENNKTNSIDMVVSLNITTSTDPVNFNVSYAYTTESVDLSTKLSSNKSKFTSTFTPQELKAGSTAYIYVLCEIANLELDASFIGTANWELTDKNEFEGEYEQDILWNYAEIKSGDYVRSAIWGSSSIVATGTGTTSKYNESVTSVTFGSYDDYSSVVSGITTASVNDKKLENVLPLAPPAEVFVYDGGLTYIDISVNNDGSVGVYRVANGSYYDVYILATQSNTKIKLNQDCSYMFTQSKGLESLVFNNMVDTSSVTNMGYMFYNCSVLSELDVSSWDTGNVNYMSDMFHYCTGLSTLDVSSWDTGSVNYMSDMFHYCAGLSILDVSGWDTSSVTDMSYMFSGCSGLSTLDLSGWDTSSVTDASSMFSGCSGLSELDLSNFDTGSVTDMSYMFAGCGGLSTLDLSGWDTSSVTNMSDMFSGCSGLSELDVSNFDTGSVTNMGHMFSSCRGLSTLDVSGFDTSSVTYMSLMFSGCSGLSTLDVSSFDTSSVTFMNYMFSGCSGLSTLDLSNFNTSSVEDMNYMFEDCSGLTAIYRGSGWSTASVTSGGCMFEGCTSLPNYNSSYVDYKYCSRYMTLKNGAGE